MTAACVTSVGVAVPATAMDQQALWEGHFSRMYGDDERAARIWRSAGVRTRHGVVDPRMDDIAAWGTEARMRRFVEEAVPLGKECVSDALNASDVEAADVGLITVVSCTGYATPGLDIILARDLAMADSVQRLSIGHMGCYAAVPALRAAADFVTARAQPAVVLCCELTSLHVQPPPQPARVGRLVDEEVQQIVAHALFADAAAAAVLQPGVPGLELVDVEARTDTNTHDHMSWDVTDLGFRMGLSPRVPDVLARHLRPVTENLLQRHRLSTADVESWIVHPGGPRILEVAADSLGLDDSALATSSEVLRNYGNCSSATVLLILQQIMSTHALVSGDHLVMLAFGPGLTLYVALFRVT